MSRRWKEGEGKEGKPAPGIEGGYDGLHDGGGGRGGGLPCKSGVLEARE